MDLPSGTEIANIVRILAVWIALTAGLGWAGGWWQMSHFYAATSRFEGRLLHLRSARFGRWIAYNGALVAGANREGLHLRVWPIFRVGHPPLFIPWSDLDATPDDSHWIAVVRFVARRCPDVPITMTRGLAERLAEQSHGSFQLAHA